MIRKATADDIDDLNRLLFQVHKVHSDIRPDLFVRGKKKYTSEQLKEILENPNTPVFVFEEKDLVLGYVFGVFTSTSNSHSLVSHKSLYIDDLCVDENNRAKGIGRALYNHIREYAKEQGCYNITLNVWQGNNSSIAFYNHLGMKVQKTVMEDIL